MLASVGGSNGRVFAGLGQGGVVVRTMRVEIDEMVKRKQSEGQPNWSGRSHAELCKDGHGQPERRENLQIDRIVGCLFHAPVETMDHIENRLRRLGVIREEHGFLLDHFVDMAQIGQLRAVRNHHVRLGIL